MNLILYLPNEETNLMLSFIPDWEKKSHTLSNEEITSV